MGRSMIVALTLVAILSVPLIASLTRPSTADSASSAQVARGEYLVRAVAMCTDCHGAALRGQTLPFKGIAGWTTYAPPITRLPMFAGDSDAVKFLQTGLLTTGARARPPMPQYRLSAADATAVVAYLRSLK